MTKQYTRQEIRQFYEDSRKPDDQGCYNIHVPTWSEMLRQDPLYCCEIEFDYYSKEFPIKPDLPWPNTVKEQMYVDRIGALQDKCNSFPWLQFILGVCLGVTSSVSLIKIFWG